MTIALLLAGGVGSRVGADCPKQFIEVCGKPIIAYTLQKLQDHAEIDGIELVCVHGFEGKLSKIVEENKITKVVNIVAGGADYEHSIINGLKALDGKVDNDDVILIHWAASPFVTGDIISDNIRVCKEKGNAISACPAYLLYGTNDGLCARQTIDRNSFMTLSAPQSFLYKNIVELYDKAEEAHIFDFVESHTTSVMAALKVPMYFSKGSQSNIKITTKDDVEFFERFVREENSR